MIIRNGLDKNTIDGWFYQTCNYYYSIYDGGFPIFPADTKEAAPPSTNVSNTSSGGSNNTKTAPGKVIEIICSLLIG